MRMLNSTSINFEKSGEDMQRNAEECSISVDKKCRRDFGDAKRLLKRKHFLIYQKVKHLVQNFRLDVRKLMTIVL